MARTEPIRTLHLRSHYVTSLDHPWQVDEMPPSTRRPTPRTVLPSLQGARGEDRRAARCRPDSPHGLPSARVESMGVGRRDAQDLFLVRPHLSPRVRGGGKIKALIFRSMIPGRRKVERRTISPISGALAVLPSWREYEFRGPSGDRRTMISTESSYVGAQLDEHHAPETNGRMSVCRRCGALTDAPGLHHVPHDRRLGRSNDWLIAQSQLEQIGREGSYGRSESKDR